MVKRSVFVGIDVHKESIDLLTTRFRRLVARGKAKPKVAMAVARELTGFI